MLRMYMANRRFKWLHSRSQSIIFFSQILLIFLFLCCLAYVFSFDKFGNGFLYCQLIICNKQEILLLSIDKTFIIVRQNLKQTHKISWIECLDSPASQNESKNKRNGVSMIFWLTHILWPISEIRQQRCLCLFYLKKNRSLWIVYLINIRTNFNSEAWMWSGTQYAIANTRYLTRAQQKIQNGRKVVI